MRTLLIFHTYLYINPCLHQQQSVLLVGPNGAGKSTLLKLIQGELRTSEGRMVINPQLRLGIFTQHHLDCFDLQISALSNMILRYPKVHEQDLRSHLGRFEIQGTDALKPMKYLSGGQKSKVAFANLTFLKPHVILLDVNSINSIHTYLQLHYQSLFYA